MQEMSTVFEQELIMNKNLISVAIPVYNEGN